MSDKPLFALGTIVVTQGIIRELGFAMPRTVALLLARHVTGDWGDLDDEDKRANFVALEDGHLRLLSAYTVTVTALGGLLPIGTRNIRIWIITEADRTSTTVLLPDEY